MPVEGDFGDEPSEPIDRLVIALRAYVRKAPKKPKKDAKPPRTTLPGAVNWRDLAPRTTPSDWVLVFDCETLTSPDQRLRFGGYQLRYKGQVWERGAFYEPDVLSEDEVAILRQAIGEEDSTSDNEQVCLRTRAEFVDEIFYQSAYGRRRSDCRLQSTLRFVALSDPPRERTLDNASADQGGNSRGRTQERIQPHYGWWFQPEALGGLAAGWRQAPLATLRADPVYGQPTRDGDHHR
jgi:hypothetical protein